MEKSNEKIRNMYALFEMCNPDFIENYQSHIPKSEIVAAKLIANAHRSDASIVVHSIDDQNYSFILDLSSRTHRSKGNWIWVKQIDIHFPQNKLFSLSIDPRVIDIPYTNHKVCAHWLFKNVTHELKLMLETYL